MATRGLGGLEVVPSILSADVGRLREQVQQVLDAGARVIQVDVMDGHFVPQITFGPLVVAALREQVEAVAGVLDVHLMIERPERYVADFASAGASNITVHFESTPHVSYAIDQIHDAGPTAGVALNPSTPAEAVTDLADAVELVLCMTVNPGWGGQRFIEHSPHKLRRLRALLADRVALQVDGGIDEDTIGRCREAGATLFVAGSAVMGASDPARAYSELVAALG